MKTQPISVLNFNGMAKKLGNQKKIHPLFFLLPALILFLLLAMSLANLELLEGYQLPSAQIETGGSMGVGGVGDGTLWEYFLRGVMALAIILLPVYIVQAMLTPEGRKRIVVDLIIIGFAFFLLRAIENQMEQELVLEESSQEFAVNSPFDDISFAVDNAIELPAIPEEAPDWLSVVILFVLTALVVTLVLAALWWVRKMQKPKKDTLDLVADQAQQALVDIRKGNDLKSAILRSYAEMSHVVKEEMGISRQQTMTARDFEQHLIQKGLPAEPIQSLTRVFEKVRYGHDSAGNVEEIQAVKALTNIIEAVREKTGDTA